jgi:hypothetical protein
MHLSFVSCVALAAPVSLQHAQQLAAINSTDKQVQNRNVDAPESGAGARAESAARGRYAIRPVPVADIDAITKHSPAIGCHYILLSMSGAVHPPLYFHNGGIRRMLAILKQHVRLVKTIADPNTYVITEDRGPLSPRLSIDGSDVKLGGPPSHSDIIDAPAAERCEVCPCSRGKN